MKVAVVVIASKNYDSFLDNWKSMIVPDNMKVVYVFGSNPPISESVTEQLAQIDLLNGMGQKATSIEEFQRTIQMVSAQRDAAKLSKSMGSITIVGDELWVDCEESLSPGIHLKTVAAFKHLLQEDFDIFVRPNLSSFFDLDKLYEWLLDKPRTNASFGWLMSDTFLSGCGYALTRDVVEGFVNASLDASHIVHEPDDLVLHTYLSNHVIPRYCWDMDSADNKYEKDMLESPHFHLRFKTENRERDAVEQRRVIVKRLKLRTDTSL